MATLGLGFSVGVAALTYSIIQLKSYESLSSGDPPR